MSGQRQAQLVDVAAHVGMAFEHIGEDLALVPCRGRAGAVLDVDGEGLPLAPIPDEPEPTDEPAPTDEPQPAPEPEG